MKLQHLTVVIGKIILILAGFLFSVVIVVGSTFMSSFFLNFTGSPIWFDPTPSQTYYLYPFIFFVLYGSAVYCSFRIFKERKLKVFFIALAIGISLATVSLLRESSYTQPPYGSRDVPTEWQTRGWPLEMIQHEERYESGCPCIVADDSSAALPLLNVFFWYSIVLVVGVLGGYLVRKIKHPDTVRL